MSSQPPGPLCDLCRKFTTDLRAVCFDITRIANDSNWSPVKKGVFKTTAFRHYDSLVLLQASGTQCTLCALLANDFDASDVKTTSGYLSLFPYDSYNSFRRLPGFGTFAPIFSDDEMFQQRFRPYPHVFQFQAHQAWQDNGQTMAQKNLPRVRPESGFDADVWDTAKKWLQLCSDDHPECRKVVGASGKTMPTRLVDVGETENDSPKLLISEPTLSAPYVALSHCWGGLISCRLLQATLETMKRGIPINSLPLNFQHAVYITRALGIRYLWIDALCIIQDSLSDWTLEAAQMGSVYASSTLTISAADACSSDEGILSSCRNSGALIDAGLMVQKTPPEFRDLAATSYIGTRGWCLQERLLAPRILHVSKQQLYWECRIATAQEDELWLNSTPLHWDQTREGAFVEGRRKFIKPLDDDPWQRWYRAMGDYSSRHLSFDNDIFPAVAGVAQVFQAAVHPTKCTYVAGLWLEDLALGLLWGPEIVVEPGRKAPGFLQCVELQRRGQPAQAPSWSWASVLGPTRWAASWGYSEKPRYTCEILGLKLPNGSLGNPMATGMKDAVVSIRGYVGPMEYRPPKDPNHRYYPSNVGRLVDEVKDIGLGAGGGCVMDFDRLTPRSCYALLVQWEDSSGDSTGSRASGLILERVRDNLFRRVGNFISIYTQTAKICDIWGTMDIDIQ
ncbi:hypothetical protein FQN54_006022 [Arachnomyces sp. PD_36]|nr:hypothetical protein FQN54_006022 [Arachnomyces sp. PD_36]